MFYRPQDGHGLPHNPFNALITPRPIGWISTRSADGSDNLAPYSFFNAVAYTPPQVMFSSTSAKADRDFSKDTMSNIRDTGVFCVNIVPYDLRDAMNASSQTLPRERDEFEVASLDKAPCSQIDCPRVAAAPASLECKLLQFVELAGENNVMAIGEVVGVHIADEILNEGLVDYTRYKPLTRLGYRDYAVIDEVFSLKRPDDAARG